MVMKFLKLKFYRREIILFVVVCFALVCPAVQAQQADMGSQAQGPDSDVKVRESKTMDLLSKIDAFTEKDDRLRMDAARAHYNMGNIYFEKGEYQVASREYYQAVTLMPDDPDAHFNLAFVSGEHLHDFKTALKHYQMYLYLNPNAKDSYFVREKISQAELALQTHIDSPIDVDSTDYRDIKQ